MNTTLEQIIETAIAGTSLAEPRCLHCGRKPRKVQTVGRTLVQNLDGLGEIDAMDNLERFLANEAWEEIATECLIGADAWIAGQAWITGYLSRDPVVVCEHCHKIIDMVVDSACTDIVHRVKNHYKERKQNLKAVKA